MTPPFNAEMLACALVLTGKATPTPDALSTALRELYPGGGPGVAGVLAGGWLVPTIDGKRLRLPPPSPAELDQRLAAAELSGLNSVKSTELNTAPKRTDYQVFSQSPEKPEAVRSAGHPSRPAQTADLLSAGQGYNAPVYPLGESTANNSNTTVTEAAGGPLFSYYRGGIAATTPYASITPGQLYAVLVSPRHKGRTEALRAAAVGTPERDALKRGLDYVTPAGTFTRRANNALERASGLLVLDFDHVPDVGTARAALLADELLADELVLLFTSPSGDGLKALVRADPNAAHLDNFRAYAAYLAGHYGPLGLRPDEAGKDVARACFVPYAPDAWLAAAYATTS